MRSISYLLILTIIISSCNSNVAHTEFKSLNGAVWNRDNIVQFSFSEMDTLQKHHMFINVRNDDGFPYSNLFLIASLTTPKGEVLQDTLEYTMALPDGTWLGKGNGSIKENKLWYKENIVFPSQGVYNLEISHAMRKNGTVSGIIALEGITDIGIEITKTNP